MTKSASETKTAEFARLFDLFERLASRRSRSLHETSNSTLSEDARAIPVPEELAPVFRNLAALVGTRTRKDNIHEQKLGGRPRRNTVAATSVTTNDSDSDSDIESVAKFPLGKQYPFTFKLMIHKLYELEEWAKKVREVVERSQVQFKPLAERDQEDTREDQGERRAEGHVHFTAGTVIGGRKGNGSLTRPRSHSVMGIGKGRDTGSLPVARIEQPKHRAIELHDDVRALKKRCVGRRKSMSGPIAGEAGRTGGAWVYDAAISSVEFHGARRGAETVAPAGKPIPPRSRYQSLAHMGRGGKTGPIARRVTSAAAGEAGWRSTVTDSGFSAKKRALSVTDTSNPEETERMRMKRPLSA